MIGLFSVLASTRFLPFGETVHLWLGRLLAFVIVYQVASWLGKVVDFIFRDLVERRTKEDGGAAATLGLLGFGIKVILITFVLLMGLRNIGVDITALITGLGLGGIAVGLALQNILGDLFASLAIVLDKPFVVGDFIVVGEFSGTVEHVGLKTTRVRSLSGEQLVFSNADLLQSRISNFQRMDRRRVQFTFKITYDASAEQLTWVPAQVKTILNNLEKVTFDRCHLKTLGDSSLEFETVYWVESADFNFYMDIQQKLNLEMLRSFRERKVQFAYPSQMLQIRSISSGKRLSKTLYSQYG
jgi:small-conductance mechanosensitive channel